ncbi:PIN-like domain-containing protein [Microbacterium sp. F1-18]
MDTNLLAGFDQYYRTSGEDQARLFEQSVIVFDTNVLLNVLRYSESARQELIDAIASVADRTFVPHQVAVEYNRNRVKVVSDRRAELDEVGNKSDEIRQSVSGLTNLLRRRRIVGDPDIETLEQASQAFLAVLNNTSQEALDKYDLEPDSLVGVVDDWTRRLDEALAGRVAAAPSSGDLEKDKEEAERRKAERLAPGFKDDAMGDYLWWAETLRWPQIVGKHLFIVSDDAAKGDWRFEQRGIAAGAHQVLIDDARNAGAQTLTLLTTVDFLKVIEGRGQAVVSESTIAESEQVGQRDASPWRFEDYLSLIAGLERDGYGDRVEVIRTAAQTGGSILREAVYQLADMTEEDRSLRHFATPALRHARRIEVSDDAERSLSSPLSALYEGSGKTIGYEVPSEFVSFEKTMVFLREASLKHSDDSYESPFVFPAGMKTVLEQHLFSGRGTPSKQVMNAVARILGADLKRHGNVGGRPTLGSSETGAANDTPNGGSMR